MRLVLGFLCFPGGGFSVGSDFGWIPRGSLWIHVHPRQSTELSQNFTQFLHGGGLSHTLASGHCSYVPLVSGSHLPGCLGHQRSTRNLSFLGDGFRKCSVFCVLGSTADTCHASVAVAFEEFQPVKEDLGSCMLARAVRTWKLDIILRLPVSETYLVRCLCHLRSTRQLESSGMFPIQLCPRFDSGYTFRCHFYGALGNDLAHFSREGVLWILRLCLAVVFVGPVHRCIAGWPSPGGQGRVAQTPGTCSEVSISPELGAIQMRPWTDSAHS